MGGIDLGDGHRVRGSCHFIIEETELNPVNQGNIFRVQQVFILVCGSANGNSKGFVLEVGVGSSFRCLIAFHS